MIIDDALAACSGLIDCISQINVPNINPNLAAGSIPEIINRFLPIILTIAGFIAVIIIIISGIEFITSSGNPEAAGKARSRLTYAIIGFIVILLSFAALQIVDYLFLKSGVV